jgi:hypothetical protein
MDRFPQAFRRFEREVDIRSFRSYRELAYAFSHWAGKRWVDSYAQNYALKREGIKLGFLDAKIPDYFRRYTPRQKRAVRRRRWKRKVRVSRVRKSVNWYVKRKYSANKIQKKLKKRGIGIRRKTLLRYVREAKKKPLKADSLKYTPKKYRRRKK